jgi:hypothetical protein
MNDLLEWMEEKHSRIAAVISVASGDPWTLHGKGHLCVGCLPIFVPEYLSDVPEIIAYDDVILLLESGYLVED